MPSTALADNSEQLLANLWAETFLGNVAQVANPGVPARSNIRFLGVSAQADQALATTGVCLATPIPVVEGDVITNVNVPIGATAGATLTHGFAAIYSGIGVPALLGQSTDIGATAAIVHEKVYPFALATPIQVTPANAPNGFVYASISFSQSAGTIPTAVGAVLLATAAHYQWFATGPLFFSATHGSAVGGTAPATIASPAVVATCPFVILT
ncbi:MAG: hypothetical protein ACLPZR_33130 [Solirubrobacteraceae bacterium]